jgi:hypothetical protein
MKKMMLLMLTLLILSVASMNAQVTIGSDKKPHPGAVLDLQSTTQGLKLPNVALDNDLSVFGLPDTDPSTAADQKGMYVYNTNPTVGEGIYLWDGYQWVLVIKGVGPVTKVVISDNNDKSYLATGQTLQLKADITPAEAKNRTIQWSAVSDNDAATINANGLLTATATGLVEVSAVASNGITATRTFAIFNPVDDPAPIVEGYATHNFGGTVWMIDNSREGTYTYRFYNEDKTIEGRSNLSCQAKQVPHICLFGCQIELVFAGT